MFIGRNALEFFCVHLYGEFLFNLPKKFRVAFTYDVNIEFQILNFSFDLFLRYADNSHTHRHTQIHTDQSETHTHTDQPLKM